MKFDLKVSAKICAVVFVFYLILTYWENAAKLIGNLFSAAFPVFLGCVLAYILNIPSSTVMVLTLIPIAMQLLKLI